MTDTTLSDIKSNLLWDRKSVTHLLHLDSETSKLIYSSFANKDFEVMVKPADGEEFAAIIQWNASPGSSVYWGKFLFLSELTIQYATEKILREILKEFQTIPKVTFVLSTPHHINANEMHSNIQI